jgi:signal transduction histidine kinase
MNVSFQNRIVFFFSGLFLTVQLITMVSVYKVSHDNVIQQISQNLVYAEQVFKLIATNRGKRIASETRILVTDYGFKSTVSDGDPKTIASALENLILRIHGHRAFYINLQGQVIADTNQQYQGTKFMFPEALADADHLGEIVVFGRLDNELYEWAVVPVLAPLSIGYVAVAIAVDRTRLEQFPELSQLPLEISLLEKSIDHTQLFSSSLPATMQPLLVNEPVKQTGTDLQMMQLGGKTMITRIQRLPSASSKQTIFAVLQIDLAQAMSPYWVMFYAALAFSGFGIAATLVGSILIAKSVSKPVRVLAGASERIMSGHFDLPIPITRNDELGRLAETFNRAALLAAQMGELKQKDHKRREMVASVSHDLRTPLTSLHGFLETLHRKADSLPPSDQQHFLEVALSQSEKVSRLAQELFELAKLECDETCLNIESFCLAELLQDVTQKYQLSAQQKSVQLTAQLRQDLPMVSGDIGLIDRLLTNLIDNAVRHTSSGGEVKVTANPNQHTITVSVADTGIGIAPEFLPTLFDWESPLARRARTEAGGFGLVIVAKIVSLHGGKIQVESVLGQGSTFLFDLPVASPL